MVGQACLVTFTAVLVLFGAITTADAQTIATEFRFPLSNYSNSVISQDLGDFNTNRGKRHLAEDVAVVAGTPVFAAASGRVMFAQQRPPLGTQGQSVCENWGHVVVMEHILPFHQTKQESVRFQTIYGHLDPDTLLVTEGQDVNVGAQIGQIGHWVDPNKLDPVTLQPKLCWGDHLHFGVRLGHFGAVAGQYPAWLAGYRSEATFPDYYCDPSTFVTMFSSSPFDGFCIAKLRPMIFGTVRYVPLFEGNPGSAGDGATTKSFGGRVPLGPHFDRDTTFEIASLFSLEGVTNGITVSAFSISAASLQINFVSRVDPRCIGGLGVGTDEHVPITVNGAHGIAASYGQQTLTSLVSNLQQADFCGGLALGDLLLESVFVLGPEVDPMHRTTWAGLLVGLWAAPIS